MSGPGSRSPVIPTAGMRLRVLVALGAAGGYESEQVVERWGDGGMDAVRFLVREGLVVQKADRYLRTPAGAAVCPTRRALAGQEPHPAVRQRPATRVRRSFAEEIEEEANLASAERPVFVADLGEFLGCRDKPTYLINVCQRLANQGRIAMGKVNRLGSTRQVWAVWKAEAGGASTGASPAAGGPSQVGERPLGGVEAGFRGAPLRAAGTGRLCKDGPPRSGAAESVGASSSPTLNPEREIEERARRASAERPLFVADLAADLARDVSNLLRLCERLAARGRIVMGKRTQRATTRMVWAVWAPEASAASVGARS